MHDAGTGPAPDPSSAAPEAFGKYFLIDKVAVGGMAEIFKAVNFGHGGFENVFVVKRILAHMSENDQFVRMFLDEARVTALLQHANVVRVWEFGKIGSNYFLTLDAVEGKDSKQILKKLFERRKMLPREFAVYIAMEAAKGLDYAHRRQANNGETLNIVHRDVSPSNLLVSYNGEVKVADFGIVQASTVDEGDTKGALKGKVEYMSPEQAHGQELDRRSDVFSLGVVLWEMLTGRRAFKDQNELRTLERVRNVELDPVSVVNAQVPARLSDIVSRCLEKDPADRYQDARELHAELTNFLYPATPDVVQQSLTHFMQELFAEEIAGERKRMQDGLRIARSLHEAAPSVELQDDWEENERGNSAPTVAPVITPSAPVPAPKASKMPLLFGGLALLGGLAAAATAVVWVLNREPETVIVEKEAPTVGPSVAVKVSPVPGGVWVDGVEVGSGTAVAHTLSAVGKHVVEVKASGYMDWKEEIEVAQGERLRLDAKLTPLPVAVVPKPERETPRPEREVVRVEPVPAPTPPPAPVVEEPPPPPVERPKGKLSANVSGGWADIFVDGKKVGQTPLIGFQLPPGTYAVRAKNEAAGLDVTKQVTVRSGESSTVAFSAR